MYLYSFTKFGGFDKVFRLPKDFLGIEEKAPSKKKGPQMGDLIKVGEEMYLVLGEKISFEELYINSVILSRAQTTIVYPKFLSKQAMQLLHWMIENYYTTYKSVVKLFVSDELEKLLEREQKSVKSKVSKVHQVESFGDFKFSKQGQTLIVFPDLRTLYGMVDDEFLAQSQVAFLSATHTDKQKDIHRWEIKKGSKSVILCTYGELFQDFKDLQKIIRVDPHKWYYANQQDPRYKVGEVLQKLAELHEAKFQTIGI